MEETRNLNYLYEYYAEMKRKQVEDTLITKTDEEKLKEQSCCFRCLRCCKCVSTTEDAEKRYQAERDKFFETDEEL